MVSLPIHILKSSCFLIGILYCAYHNDGPNRQDAKTRLETHADYLIHLKAEEEMMVILDNLDAKNNAKKLIYEKISSL